MNNFSLEEILGEIPKIYQEELMKQSREKSPKDSYSLKESRKNPQSYFSMFPGKNTRKKSGKKSRKKSIIKRKLGRKQ